MLRYRPQPCGSVSNVSLPSQAARTDPCRPPASGCWLLAGSCRRDGATGRAAGYTDVYILYVESCLPSDEHAPEPFAVASVACTIELLMVNALFIAYISVNDAPAEPSNGLLGGTSPGTGRTC